MVMTYCRAMFTSPRRLMYSSLCLWVIVTGVWQVLFMLNNPQRSWLDLWVTPDQQGQWYFSRGEYRKAAQRFESAQWQAVAYYASENFSAAEILWGRQPGYLPLFYRANALAHLERYQEAIDSYQLSLQLKSDFLPTIQNLELVTALAKKPDEVTDFSGNTGARLEADDIVFDDDDSQRMQQATETEETDTGNMSSEEIQALWMRRLQSKPVDFLTLKFRYQLQESAQ